MDAEVDVLVAGAGAAGMTAALVCALNGLDVLLCEKSSQVGGTTATSAGTIWVPGTRQAREAGFKDDIPEARRYLDSIIGAATDGRREAYLATGPELVEYLAAQQRGEILALRQASGLSVQPPRHDARGPRAGAAAVRRPAARRRFRAAAPADRRVHGARRHDDRPRRHRAAVAPVWIGCELPPRALAALAARHRPPAPPRAAPGC